MLEKPTTKKTQKQKERDSEEQMAKGMSYETIVQNIASAKKAINVLQTDINGLVDKRIEQESLISKMNRVMLLKKKQMGA